MAALHTIDAALTKVRSLIHLGQLHTARDFLNVAIAELETSDQLWLSKANVHHQLGELAQASDCYQECLRANPECIEAYIGYLVLLCDTSHYSEAEALYQQLELKIQKQGPDFSQNKKLSEAHQVTARAYSDAGMHHLALQELTKAQKLQPQNLGLKHKSAKVYFESGHIDQALTELSDLQNHCEYEGQSDIATLSGFVFLKQSQPSQALNRFKEAQKTTENIVANIMARAISSENHS